MCLSQSLLGIIDIVYKDLFNDRCSLISCAGDVSSTIAFLIGPQQYPYSGEYNNKNKSIHTVDLINVSAT